MVMHRVKGSAVRCRAVLTELCHAALNCAVYCCIVDQAWGPISYTLLIDSLVELRGLASQVWAPAPPFRAPGHPEASPRREVDIEGGVEGLQGPPGPDVVIYHGAGPQRSRGLPRDRLSV